MNCKKIFAYGLADAGGGEFNVVPHVKGPFAVYELGGSVPRYALFAGSERGSDEHALSKTADFTRVITAEDAALPILGGEGQTGSVEVISYRSGKVKLHVKTNVPAILRAADRYDPDWKATLDGKRVDVGRVDFLCMGVAVPTGEHMIVLRYAPSLLFLYMQVSGLVILLVVGALMLRKWMSTHAAD